MGDRGDQHIRWTIAAIEGELDETLMRPRYDSEGPSFISHTA
jgi:hypothetical protein